MNTGEVVGYRDGTQVMSGTVNADQLTSGTWAVQAFWNSGTQPNGNSYVDNFLIETR